MQALMQRIASRKADYDRIVRHSRLVIDSRNACAVVRSGRSKIVKA
jgi:hypothetical protein